MHVANGGTDDPAGTRIKVISEKNLNALMVYLNFSRNVFFWDYLFHENVILV